MNEISALTARVEALERRWRSTVALAGVLALGLLAVTIASCVRDPRDILKVRGIVITDAAGNDRIVLGAPIGDVSDDPRLVQTVGAVVLDESDRLNVAGWGQHPARLLGRFRRDARGGQRRDHDLRSAKRR